MKYQEAFDKLAADVEEILAPSGGGHDFDHTLRVMKNCRILLEDMPEADGEIVMFAALLHDCARPVEHESCGRICHAAAGAEMAADMMKKYALPDDFIRKCAEAVRTHRYRDDLRPQSLEGEILFDADKLDSLGAVGIGRAFLFAGMCGARVHNTAAEALAGKAYGKEDTAYREYLVKLRHLPEAMLTGPGRKLALYRAEMMKDFFEELNRECAL